MQYTTLEDLKEWPKLHKEACRLTVEAGNEPVDSARLACPRETFDWDKDPQGRNFWVYIFDCRIDAANTLRPELFEEEQAFVVGMRVRAINDSYHGLYKIGQEFTIQDIFYDEERQAQECFHAVGFEHCLRWMLRNFEPLPAEQEEEPSPTPEDAYDVVVNHNPGKNDWTSNTAMLARDGEEEMCNTQELWDEPNPMSKHSEALSRAVSVTPFAITKFDPRGM